MINRRYTTVVLVCFAIVLAGCTGWGTDGPVDEEDPEPDEADALESTQDETEDANGDNDDDATEADSDNDGGGDDSADSTTTEDDTSNESDDNNAEETDESDEGSADDPDSDSTGADGTSSGESSDALDEPADSSDESDSDSDGSESDEEFVSDDDGSQSDANGSDNSDDANDVDDVGDGSSGDENSNENDEGNESDESNEEDENSGTDDEEGDAENDGNGSEEQNSSGDDENDTEEYTLTVEVGEMNADGAVITVEGEDYNETMAVDDSGLTEFVVPDGEYDVHGVDQNGNEETQTVAVEGDETITLSTLESEWPDVTTVAVFVENESGEPIEGATVDLHAMTTLPDGTDAGGESADTDRDGEVSLETYEIGYEFGITADGYEDHQEMITVEEDDERTVTLEEEMADEDTGEINEAGGDGTLMIAP